MITALNPLRLLILSALCLGLGGCGVDDFADDGVEDGFRESLHLLTAADLEAEADGSGALTFEYRYGLGIKDDEGIDEVRWVYRLVSAEGEVLAEVEQQMREPQLEKTEILVEGRRSRTLEIEPGRLSPGGEYVLWFDLSYRGERIGEHLEVVQEGIPYQAATDELPVPSR